MGGNARRSPIERIATFASAVARYPLAAYTRKAYSTVMLFIELPLFGRYLRLTDDELRVVQREIEELSDG